MYRYNKHTGADLKEKRYESNPYKAFIRKKPCVICGARKAEVHHEQITGRGIGIKCSDYETVPLCKECHRRRHDIGKYNFWLPHFYSDVTSCIMSEEDIDFALIKLMFGYLAEYIHRS